MSCYQDPIPAGWSVWRKAVPAELAQFAIDVRDHINSYPYGQIAQTTTYQGQTVGAFKSHHVWTYRKQPDGSMQLVTGICIPGVSLLTQNPPSTGAGAAATTDDLSTPDPSAAAYGVDPGPGTDWGLVTACGVALAVVVGGFAFMLRHAGRAA